MERSQKNPRPGFYDDGAWAITKQINQYPLPKGLVPGTLVQIVSYDHGYSEVIDEDGNLFGRVFKSAISLVEVPNEYTHRLNAMQQQGLISDNCINRADVAGADYFRGLAQILAASEFPNKW